MNVEITQTDNRVMVALEGRLDTMTAPEFEKNVTPYFSMSAVELILDCVAMEYISSAGLRVVLMTHKNVTAHGGHSIAQIPPRIKIRAQGLIQGRVAYDQTGLPLGDLGVTHHPKPQLGGQSLGGGLVPARGGGGEYHHGVVGGECRVGLVGILRLSLILLGVGNGIGRGTRDGFRGGIGVRIGGIHGLADTGGEGCQHQKSQRGGGQTAE